MTQSDPSLPPPPPPPALPGGGLQFDTAEPAAGPAAPPTCVGCNRPILDTYYAAGDKLVCPDCRDQYVVSLAGGSGFARFLKATLFGIIAGTVGAAIWYGIMVATNAMWALVALLVGFMVGAGIRMGSEGRGGRGYQFLALILTYYAVCAPFIPELARDGIQQDFPAILAIAVAMVVCVAVPFLGGFGVIGAFIAALALWQAWSMNKKSEATLSGPYSIASRPGAPPLPPPPPVPVTSTQGAL